MEQNKIKITYNPKEIIEYLEKNGSITPKDLEKMWGYDKSAANIILRDLDHLEVVVPEKIDAGIYLTKYHLTESGSKMKNSLQPRTIELTHFPVISKITREIFNDAMETLQIKGIGAGGLREMLESNSPELRKLIEETKLSVLKDLSPEELRQLAKEVEEN